MSVEAEHEMAGTSHHVLDALWPIGPYLQQLRGIFKALRNNYLPPCLALTPAYSPTLGKWWRAHSKQLRNASVVRREITPEARVLEQMIKYSVCRARKGRMLPWLGSRSWFPGRCGAGVAFPDAWFWCPQWSQCTHRLCSF